MKRGFKKEIFDKTNNNFGIKIPKDLKEATEFIESNQNIKNFIKQYITNILISSKKELEAYFKKINENTIISKYRLDISLGESIENIIKRLNILSNL